VRLAVAVALLTTAISGCAFDASDPVVDGWPIGPEGFCTTMKCRALLDTAQIGFDRRDPEHPAVVRVVLHDEGMVVDEHGNRMLVMRSGSCCSVARFELADGSVRAIGVGYPGVSRTPVAVDYGP
jgi:hypothetical protein